MQYVVSLTVHVMKISPFLPPYPAKSVGVTTGTEKEKRALNFVFIAVYVYLIS